MSRPLRLALHLAGILATVAAVAGDSAPVTVTPLEKGKVPAAVDRIQYDSLSTALRNLQFDALDDPELPASVTRFGRSLHSLADGNPESASERFRALTQDEDPDLRAIASRIYAHLLSNSGDYAALRAFSVRVDGKVPPNVSAMSRAPRESLKSLSKPAARRLTLTPTGSPIIEVVANGRKRSFVFDSGAALSLVTRSTAKSLGIDLIEGPEIPVGTSTDITVAARYGVLAKLRAGQVEIRNHLVLVVADEIMQFELPDGREFAIEGIVGWNAIRRLRAGLDYPGGTYQLQLSRPHDYGARNFFWLGYPLVRLSAADGQRLLFRYDSGSRNSTISSNIFDKIEFTEVRTETQTIGGAGGSQEVETAVVDRLSLIIGGLRFDVPDARRESNDDAVFVVADGTLGSDIAQRCRVTVDFPNAWFGIEVSRGE